jgi:hypothetical protein
MVLDHASEHPSRWAAVTSIAAKIGCTPQTLHDWVKKADVDSGRRAGVPTEKLKAGAGEPRAPAGQRDPAQGERLFYDGGARSPVQAMIGFIDDHRGALGVEPIGKVSPIAPSTYRADVTKRQSAATTDERYSSISVRQRGAGFYFGAASMTSPIIFHDSPLNRMS